MPRSGRPVVTVSCHVERPLDDLTWGRLEPLLRKAPGGFRIAALVRPPDRGSGEDPERWVERVSRVVGLVPVGYHAHFGGPEHGRPREGERPVERVREDADWLASVGFRPGFFCGGAWYMDSSVGNELAARGHADCTAMRRRWDFLPEDAPRLEVAEPCWLTAESGRIFEVPTTHSLGTATRAFASGALLRERFAHLHFHDWELSVGSRRRALSLLLHALSPFSVRLDLDEVEFHLADAPVRTFASALAGSAS